MAHLGHYISGAGHAGLIGFVLVGPLFATDPLPFETVSVSVVTSQEFAALSSQPRPTALPEAPDAPEAPPAPLEEAPDLPALTETPPDVAPPDQPTAPAAETVLPTPPVPPAPVDAPQTEVPTLITPDVLDVPDAPEVAETPSQRPSDRVAPTPVAPPEPDATIAEETREAVVDDPGETPGDQPEQEATAPEEAATTIVTEAEAGPPAAPERSIRPQSRPTAVAARPAPPVEETPPTPDDPAPDSTASAIADALQQALQSTDEDPIAAPDPSLPVGPPLTAGEREGLVLAVQNCWAIDPGSPAAEVVVVVGINLTPEGRVDGAVRRLSATGGDPRAQEVAFQAARRAVLRCQRSGYALPPEKYAQWQEVEITFNPASMRVR